MAIADQRNGDSATAPPQNLEAEQSVLGAVLLSDTALPALIIDERLQPEDFYREAHGLIFQAMLDLHTVGEPVDALTLVEHLKQAGLLENVGGRAAVDLLAGSVPAVGNVRQYARIVRENAMLRRLLRASYEIQARVHSHEAPPRELVDLAERSILEVAHDDRRKDFRAIHDLLSAELDKLEQLSAHGTSITGTPSGFEDLDRITGGFQPGNLIILAARPGMGKSALMANFAEHAALTTKQAVALFSLEMSEGELAQRFIASQASIKGDDLRKGKVPQTRWAKILAASNRLAESSLFVDDSSDLSVLDVRAKTRRLAQQQADGLGLVLIDYLQLMRASGQTDNRAEQVGQISRGLKTLARELEVPVIALSQLNRGVEQRADKRPMLSDLRESGAIEQDADLVMFIYRDEYYDEDSEDEGMAEVHIAKHRNGGLGHDQADVPGRVPALHVLRRRGALLVAPCPDGRCDGSGFLYDEDTRKARDCSCRPRRLARRKARKLAGVIPRRYQGVSFDRAPVTLIEPTVVREVRKYVDGLEGNLTDGKGIWFEGDVGTGKTTLAMLISAEALKQGHSVAIYSLPRLLGLLRETFDDDSEASLSTLLERLAAVELLHIDDVGAEQSSPWVLEQLYTIVNTRYEDDRAVVLTTNLSPPELQEQIGERTVSRIIEMCGDPLLLKGTDQRVSMPDPFASDTPVPYGEPRARRLAS